LSAFLTFTTLSAKETAMAPSSARPRIEWQDAGDVAVLNVTDRWLRDEHTIIALFDEVDRLAEASGRRQLVLNFGRVEYLASYAMGKLVGLHKKLQESGGRLALCSLTPVVAEIIDILKLRRLFHIYTTEQEALQSF
jgi:anti-sigma B factor antagonist